MQHADFIQDFPSRCRKLLEQGVEVFNEHEVTFMLMVAAAGVVIPVERLKRRESELKETDGAQFLKVKMNLQERQEEVLERHDLFWDSLSSIQYECREKPRDLQYVARGKLPSDFTFGKLLEILRHSLAHGNVYTVGEKNGHISKLTFGSSIAWRSTTYHLISMPVESFKRFLLAWFNYLAGFEFEQEMISSVEPL